MTKAEKEKLEKDTEELVTANLPIPKEIKAFYKKCVEPSIGRGYEYAEYITERKGRLLQRIFCFQVFGLGGKKPRVREIARRYEGGKLVCSNLIGGYMSNPYLPDTAHSEEMHESGWDPKYAGVVQGNTKANFTNPYICVNEKSMMKKYPYCAYDQYRGYLCMFKYLCAYRKYPLIELLVKAGYANFVPFAGWLDMNGKTVRQIFKVKQDFAAEYLKHGSSYDLSILRKNEWIDSADKLVSYEKVLHDDLRSNFSDEELRYVACQRSDLQTYKDYLRIADLLAYPLHEKRYKYPKNLKEAHDEASKTYKVILDAKNDAAIKAVSEQCGKLAFAKNGYCIFPLSCSQDLIDESAALNHCVRSYVDRVVKGESLILFVRKESDPGKPFVTLELVKPKNVDTSLPLEKQFTKISQVHGLRNAAPDADTAKFIMSWKKENHLTGWKAA